MPRPPLPPDHDRFLWEPNFAVIATLRPDGAPHTAVTWYLWQDGRVLINMDAGRKRLANMRRDPRVSLSVPGREDPYRQLTLLGRAVSIEPDPDLESIDRIARHYTGADYRRRDQARVDAWIEVDSWYGWIAGRPWTDATGQDL